MSDPNPVQPYRYGPSQVSEFERKGHPGKFLQSITCAVGTTHFTGSYFGVGGLIVPNSSVGTASLSLGGEVPLGILATNSPVIHEFSLKSVKVDSGGPVYALIRNQMIR